MKKFLNLAYRRNLFFPTSEIYNNIAGFFEYGPIGVRIKNKIIDSWANSNSNEVEADGGHTL